MRLMRTVPRAIGFGITGMMFLALAWSMSDAWGLMVWFGGMGLVFMMLAIGFFVTAKKAMGFEQDLKDERFWKGHLG